MGKSSRKPFTWFFISIWLLRLCHQILQFIHIVKAIEDSKIEINLWWQMFVIRSHFCKFFSDNFSNHVESTFWFYFVKHYQFQSIFGIFMIPLYHQSKCVYFMLSLFLSVKISGFILISGLILVLILFGIIGQSSYFFLAIDLKQKTMTISTIFVFLSFSSRPNMPIQARLWACGRGDMSTSSFGIYLNPISTRGAAYAHPILMSTQSFESHRRAWILTKNPKH